MNKKLIKKQNYITIEKFLRDYCKIENETLISILSELSHKELKAICEELYKLKLVSVPFEVVDQAEISCGEIIIVQDAHNNPAPYINPSKEITLEENKIEITDNTYNLNDLINEIEEKFTLPEDTISQKTNFTITKRRKKVRQ